MANSDDKPALKITLEDLASVELPAAAPAGNMAPAAAGAKQYGNIAAPADGPAMVTEEKGHIFLQGWFYLGVAGWWARWSGWGICEPFFVDAHTEMRWGNYRYSAVCRSCLPALAWAWLKALWSAQAKKALIRGLLSLGAWVWCSVSSLTGSPTYFLPSARRSFPLWACRLTENPAFWLVRGIAWAVFGVAGGIVYGLVDRSGPRPSTAFWAD